MRSSRAASVVLAALASAACGPSSDDRPAAPPAGVTQTPTGPRAYAPPPPERQCKVDVVAKGEGREVKKGDVVLAHLVFTLADGGKVISDTRAEGEPQPIEAGGGSCVAAAL